MNKTLKSNATRRLVVSALCLALCMLLPFLTGQIPQIGVMLSPMHIPVLLCGFLCGWQYGLVVGVIAPLLRSLLFGMPALFPMGAAMSLELAVYGVAAGLLYRTLPKKNLFIYVALVAAMLAGRAAWGAAMALFTVGAFTMNAFWVGAFVSAAPGIVLHLAIIPPIVMALRKSGYLYHA